MATAELSKTLQQTTTAMTCRDCPKLKYAGAQANVGNAQRHAMAFPGHRVVMTFTTEAEITVNLVP